MHIDDKLIDQLSETTMLEFTDAEKVEIKDDLNRITSFMNKLNELDTEGVEPLIYMSEEVNVLREDQVGDMLTREEAFANAPLHDSDYIKVPKFINRPS